MEASKRAFLRAAALLVADRVLARGLPGSGRGDRKGPDHKVILVIIGGVRRQETFSREGLANIPYLSGPLLSQSLFYSHVRNEGVTAHFNAISSILTGTWQRVGDWGELPPSAPTLFEYFRKQMRVPPSEAWIVASNKALTNLIGASSAPNYGPAFGANAVLPKQLLIEAVEETIQKGEKHNLASRSRAQAQLEAMLEGSNYEGLGWSVFDASNRLDPRVHATVREAIAGFIRGSGPMTGDELTFFMSREIMRKFAPGLLAVVFSDVEVAHFGPYSLHVAGIRNADRLCHQLWEEVEANSEYRGRTTMVVLPEFGRDPDGSTTNGFFNHRSNDDSCRMTWMLCRGAAVDRPQVVERPIRHIDLCPTLAPLLGCRSLEGQGGRLEEFRA